MSSPGKAVRLSRIFSPNYRTLIVPIDHGLGSGPINGLENSEKILQLLISSKVNAIITSYGVASKYSHMFGQTGLIIRVDGGPTDHSEDPEGTAVMCTVEDAVRLGADGIITSIWIGGAHEERAACEAMKLAGACELWGLPLIIEPFISANIEISIENIALGARVAAELGADIVKTYLRGDKNTYKKVVDSCFRPLVILGGEKSDNPLNVLSWARTALDAGATGTCIGRNIFQHENPAGLLVALNAIIHEDMTVEQASILI